jgi:transcription elongation factor S-II
MIITDEDKFRQNIKTRFSEILKSEKLGDNLERGIFNRTIQKATEMNIVKKWNNAYFSQLYTDWVRSIYINIQKNPTMLTMLQDKKLKAHEFAFMNHQEMNPKIWKELIENKKIRDKYKYESALEASTDLFTCRACKSKKCTYTQQQTRSADEPMTTFVTCLNCGKRWKC